MEQKVFVREITAYSSGIDAKLYELQTRKGILVYGFREDSNILKYIYLTVTSCHPRFSKGMGRGRNLTTSSSVKKGFMVIQISKEVEKQLLMAPAIKEDTEAVQWNNNPNIFYWKDFLKHEILRKCLTANHIIQELIQMQLPAMNLRKELLKDFEKDYDELKKVIDKWKGHVYITRDRIEEYEIEYIEEWMEQLEEFKKKHGNVKVPLLRFISIGVGEFRKSEGWREYTAFLKFHKIRLENFWYLKTEEQIFWEELERKYQASYKKLLSLIRNEKQQLLLTNNLNLNNNGEDNTLQEGGS